MLLGRLRECEDLERTKGLAPSSEDGKRVFEGATQVGQLAEGRGVDEAGIEVAYDQAAPAAKTERTVSSTTRTLRHPQPNHPSHPTIGARSGVTALGVP